MTNNPINVVKEKTKLTDERIADLLEVSRQTVNNYIKNPGQIPAEKIFKLSSVTGISVENLYGATEVQKGPCVKPTYSEKSKKLSELEQKARVIRSQLSSIKIGTSKDLAICCEERDRAVEELNDLIAVTSIKGRKPTICAFGPSDAGKSTLINYLLGEEIVPAGYSPMTTVPTYIMHTSEKPDYLNDPVDNTVVFGRKSRGKKSLNHAQISANPEDYIIRKGSYKSILKEFGTRDGDYYRDSNLEIAEIAVYAEADFLREATFIDIPGFGSGDDRDDVGLMMDASTFDVVFFLSTADAYLRGNEITAFCNILRMREDLSSVYMLATHTNSIGDPEKLKKVIYLGCERIVRAMSDDEKERLGLHEEKGGFKALEKRCLGFDMSSEKYCKELNDRIENEMPRIINKRLNNATKEAKKACKTYKEKYLALLSNIEKERRSSKSVEEEKKAREKRDKEFKESIDGIKAAKQRLMDSIDDKEGYSLSKMKTDYGKVINENFIIAAIERKGLKNRKADIEDLSSYLSEELNSRLQKTLAKGSEDFSDELKKELEDYRQNIEEDAKKLEFDFDFSGFDFTRAFASGLAGVATYGALAVWASVVAQGSNLGAYILVAKVVSALSALGISVGGAAAATSLVASIGGPVMIAISLAIVAAVAVFGIFTGTWKSRVAKRLIKTYEENYVLDKCNETIKTHWSDTAKALDACIDALHAKLKKYYSDQNKKNEMSPEAYIKMSTILQMVYKYCVDGYENMTSIVEDGGTSGDAETDGLGDNEEA